MAIEMFALVPGIILLFLANYTEKRKELRLITQVILVVSVLFLIFQGVMVLETDILVNESMIDPQAYGYGMIIAGLIAFLIFIKPVRKGLASLMQIDADNWLHATALIFAIILIGTSLATALGFDILALSKEAGISLTSIIIQDTLFVITAFLGVGWLSRRNWSKLLIRLGLVKPGLKDIALSFGFFGVILVIIFGLSIISSLLGLESDTFEIKDDPTIQMLGGVTLFSAIIIAFGAGIGEEILFRGAMQPRFGILITSIIFAIVHVQYLNPMNMLVLLAISLALGYERKILNTTACIITHTVYDLFILGLVVLI